MMIITSSKKLEPGKIYTEKDFDTPFQMLEEDIYKFTFLVIRETTHQEFREHCIKEHGLNLTQEILDFGNYYEIHSD